MRVKERREWDFGAGLPANPFCRMRARTETEKTIMELRKQLEQKDQEFEEFKARMARKERALENLLKRIQALEDKVREKE